LKPTGLPVMSRMRAMVSSRSPIEAISEWRLGEMESWPAGMPRIAAISGVTLAPGRIPPLPGLAPCDSLISNIFTWGSAAMALSRAGERSPVSSRTPYLAVPIWKTMSAPPSR
jgi:hypothetical protein